MKASDHNRLSYFEAIVEAFDGMVYVCSPDNRIEFVNHQAVAQLGRDPVGESCHEALYGNDGICPWCPEQDVFQRKDGSMGVQESLYAAMVLQHGQPHPPFGRYGVKT